MRHFLSLVARFRSDERGAFLAIFGIVAVVLVAMSGAVVDYTSVEQARTRAQVALDAAALALQPQIYTKDTTQLGKLAQAILLERLGSDDGWTICASIEVGVPPCTKLVSTVVNLDDGSLTLRAHLDVPLFFVALIGIDHMRANLVSQATRGSANVEVAVALDTTGSMAGTKISDLRTATKDLIDLVVQDVQTPTYSKMAIIPYSMGVNAGPYAASVRGAIKDPTTITGATWFNGSKIITAATKANPIVITSNAHGFANGDTVYISGVSGMTQLNGNKYLVASVTANTFSLKTNPAGVAINSSSYSAFTTPATGTAKRCYNANCDVLVTSPAHGLTNGEGVYITGVGGMTQINNPATTTVPAVVHTVASATIDTFILSGVSGVTYSAYTSGGTAACVRYGCSLYRFTNVAGKLRMLPISTCITERNDTYAYTDEPPTTVALGLNYPTPSGNGACLDAQIMPLTTDKTALKGLASSLQASGYTSGHIGLSWAWYMLSPRFSSLWPTASKPAAYDAKNLLKVVVLMTDGEFNNAYCNGVISSDSNAGASTTDRINCAAPLGKSDVQALQQCAAIKAAGIVIYTVGFQVNSTARTMLTKCASVADKAYFPADGKSLSDVFKDIARNISELRTTL